MKIDLSGKVAIVTGASRGIGSEIKNVLENCGSVVHDFSRTSGVDITNFDVLKSKIDEIGEVEILVNNAGVFVDNDVNDILQEKRLWTTNVSGMLSCIKVISAMMKSRKYGRIINMSSIDGVRGYSKHSIYSSTKGAIISLTRSVAVELGKYNITVNSVSPGFVRTEMTEKYHDDEIMRDYMLGLSPMKKCPTTKDVAYLVAFLASDLACSITGQNICVDCGVTC